MPKQELRSRIGFVPQKAFLFSGTILDNFRHGKKDATMEELRSVAQIAQIGDFINGLEQGYDMPVMQGGNNFDQHHYGRRSDCRIG